MYSNAGTENCFFCPLQEVGLKASFSRYLIKGKRELEVNEGKWGKQGKWKYLQNEAVPLNLMN